MTFEDIQNKADYKANGIGAKVNKNNNADYNEKGITPDIGMPASGEAESTTKATISEGTIEIRDKENQKQDITKLNRDTQNSLNKLGEIFDKTKIEERQELANLFGELAYNEIHYMDGSNEQKALYHAAVGGIMSKLTNGDFLSGASAAGINKLVIEEIDKVAGGDPDKAQWVSAVLGAVISGLVSGNTQAGGSAAASGTKNNEYLKKDVEKIYGIGEVIKNLNFERNDDDPVFGYTCGGGVSAILGGEFGIVVSPDKVFLSAGATLGANLSISSLNANKIYVLNKEFDLMTYLANGLIIPKDSYVKDIETFNNVMRGVPVGGKLEAFDGVYYGITPDNYKILMIEVGFSVGASVDYSITW